MKTFAPKTQQVRRSLRYSIADGSAYAAMLGFAQDYITPFALALKATVFQVGLLSSIPNLTMALSQLGAPQLTKKAGSRKRLLVPVALIHALIWLPILLIPYLLPGQKVWWLIGLFTLSTALGSLGSPAWGSLMADLVPESLRGRFFGLRGRICGLINLAFYFIGGMVLHFTEADTFVGFSILLAGALVFRLISWYFLSRMYEPPISSQNREQFGLMGIISKIGSSNLGRFTIGVALTSLATNIASPFFAVYMLQDLKLDYLIYVVVTATSSVASFAFMTFWGRRADRAGNAKVLKITSVLIPFVPLLWLGSHQIYYLVLVQALSGFAWAGFNLASTNFVYDAAPPKHRMQHIAIFNAMNGGAVCLGALLGGYLAQHLPPIMGFNLLTLFLVSGLLRGLVVVIFLRRVSEVRNVPEVSTAELLLGRSFYVQEKGGNGWQPVPNIVPWLKARKTPRAQLLPPIRRHKPSTSSRAPPS